MADNGAKLDMPNGAHEEYGAGTSLEGQELYWAETPVEGDAWFVGCDYDHRDAAFGIVAGERAPDASTCVAAA